MPSLKYTIERATTMNIKSEMTAIKMRYGNTDWKTSLLVFSTMTDHPMPWTGAKNTYLTLSLSEVSRILTWPFSPFTAFLTNSEKDNRLPPFCKEIYCSKWYVPPGQSVFILASTSDSISPKILFKKRGLSSSKYSYSLCLFHHG